MAKGDFMDFWSKAVMATLAIAVIPAGLEAVDVLVGGAKDAAAGMLNIGQGR